MSPMGPAKAHQYDAVAPIGRGEFEMNAVLSFFGSGFGLAVSLLIAALGVYLLWTHTGHVLAALPYLILLACPLMHFFGHGHGHKRHDKQPGN